LIKIWIWLAIAAIAVPHVLRPADAAADSNKDCTTQATVRRSVTLDSACRYLNAFQIVSSDVEFDCAGATIDGEGKRSTAIKIGADPGVRNVTVRNCNLVNNRDFGVVVTWLLPDRQKVEQYSPDERQRLTTADVRIENTTIVESGQSGIFLDDTVTTVTIARVQISRSGGPAIYLAHSGGRHTIEDSEFFDNGRGLAKRPKARGSFREAIAVDSSARNLIRRNVFRNNGAGGVFLYKNCQEKITTNANSVVRWQASEYNRIEQNKFIGEDIGVWVASRQSRDLSSWDCGDRYYSEGRYVLDRAPANTIADNIFTIVRIPIQIEDDDAAVTSNVIASASDTCLRVGTPIRSAALKRPVTGTTVEHNSCKLTLPAAGSSGGGFEFMYGAVPKRFEDNRLEGVAAAPSLRE
jgi:hypothetical protein